MSLSTQLGEYLHSLFRFTPDRFIEVRAHGLCRKVDPSHFTFLDILRVREKATYIVGSDQEQHIRSQFQLSSAQVFTLPCFLKDEGHRWESFKWNEATCYSDVPAVP